MSSLPLLLTFFSCTALEAPHNFHFNYDIVNARELMLLQVFSDDDRTYLKALEEKENELQVFNEEGNELTLFYDDKMKLFFFEGTPDSFSLKKEGKSAFIKRLRDKRLSK